MKKGEEKKNEALEKKNFIFIALLAIIFVIIFSYFVSQSETFKKPVIEVPRNMSGYEEFTKNLFYADSLSIVENLTDVPENLRYVVINCGSGLAKSWGDIGKNISKLYIYVINGNECYYSYPTMVNVTGKLYELRNLSECKYTTPYFYISYGSSFSIFSKDNAIIYVDENYKGECFFQIKNESMLMSGTNKTNETNLNEKNETNKTK
jgi:hypothetical protein